MIWLLAPAAALFGYLLGSVPVGVLVCRLFGVDLRQIGSGRTGTTNAWRAAGLKAAIPTLLGDALKGAVAILIVERGFLLLFPEPATMSVAEAETRLTALALAKALAGGLAIIGHNWSLFLGFKGGAGGITSAATTMALSPLVGGIVWVMGILIMWWTRMASLGTMVVGISAFALFLMLGLNDLSPRPYIIYGAIALISVIVALRRNREALRKGEERVITLW